MSDDEAPLRVHPLRHVSVFIYAFLVLLDTFFLVFTTTLLANRLGASPFMAGLIGAISPMFSLFTGLFWGWMADKYGRRWALIISGVFAVPALLSYTIATELWQLVVAATVRGIGGSAGMLISRVLVSDLTPRKALGERLAGLSLVTSFVSWIPFAVSGWLWDIDYRLPFLVAMIPEAIALLLAVFAVPETLAKKTTSTDVMKMEERKFSQHDQGGSSLGEWVFALTRRGAALYVFAMLMTSIATVANTMAFPLFAENLRFTGSQISLAYTVGMTVGVFSFVPSAVLSDRFGRKWPVLVAGFGGALMWPLYALVPNMANPFIGFLLLQVVSSVASSVGGPAFLAYFFEWIPMRGRGRAIAIAELLQSLVTVIVLPLISWIYVHSHALERVIEWLKTAMGLYFTAIVGVVTYIVVWIAWKEAPLPEAKWKLRTSTIVLLITGTSIGVILLLLLIPPLLQSAYI